MRSRTHFCVLLTVLVLAPLTGCGDSPELRMQQAKIAMANGKPDETLKHVEAVLKAEPDNFEALSLKARSQMLLAQLRSSKKTLDKMLEMRPDDADIRRHLVDWSWMQIRNTLSQSEFVTSEKAQKAFEETMKTGLAQADWLAEHENATAESLFYKAKYAELDAQRFGLMLRAESRSLSGTDLDQNIEAQSSIEVERIEREIEDRYNQARQYLREVLAEEPDHFKACEMYARLLVQGSHWVDLWELVQRTSEVEGLPDRTASQMIAAALSTPASVQPPIRVLKVGWKIQNAVKKEQQESPIWKITSARLHMAGQQFDKAQPLLEDALKRRSSDIEGQYLLAQSLYGQEKFDQARDTLEKLRRKAPRSSRVQALYGLTLMRTGETVLAKEALRLATELNPREPMAREGFLALMVEEGHITEARRDIDAYYNLKPTDPRAIRFKMQFELANARREEVEKLMTNVEKISPLTDEHVLILIDGYMVLQDYAKAQRYARDMVKRKPNTLAHHLRFAEALLMQGRDDQVRQMLVELREQFPHSASVNQLLGRLYLQRQSYDRAIEMLELVVGEEPANVAARILLAQSYASMSLTDEALDQVERVLEQDPTDFRAHALASRIYQFMGQRAKAAEHLEQIDESAIDEKTSPSLLAQLMIKRNKMDEALAICNRAVASGNSDPVLRLLLAGIYRSRNEPDQVEVHLKALVHSQPKNAQAFSLLSRFYVEQKQVKKGLVELQPLQTLNEPLARMAQARLLLASKQPEAALLKLEPVMGPLIRRRDPMALVIADAIARINVSRGKQATAIAAYDQLIEADLLKGQAMLRKLDLKTAESSSEQIVEKLDELAETLTPEQQRLGYQVLQRYIRLGQFDRAKALVDGWITDRPNIAMLRRIKGQLQMQTGQPESAVTSYEEAVRLAPESVGMRLRLAEAHMAMYDHDKAEKIYREAAEIDGGARITALTALGHMFLGLGLHTAASDTFNELERLSRSRDPRVIYSMGTALMILGQDDLAIQRLENIPTHSRYYPRAQIVIARIEQRRGRVDQAEQRLKKLGQEARYVNAVVSELVAIKRRSASEDDLARWSDKALNMESLSKDMKIQWLGVRARLAVGDNNWLSALETISQMSRMQPESMPLVAARVVLMLRLKQTEQARQLYRATPALATTQLGPVLAAALNETPADVPGIGALPSFILAMSQGDLDAARTAIEAMPPHKTLFRQDLLTIIDRPDATSKETAQAFELLGCALVSLEYFKMPQLTEELTQAVIKRVPGVAPAYGMLVQALIDQGKPLDDVIDQMEKSLPTSGLKLYIKGRNDAAEKDFEQAIEQFRTLIQREPANYHARYMLTQILREAGQIDPCIAELEAIRALGETPYQIVVANDLAYLLALNHPERIEEANQIAEEAVSAAPRVVALQDTLGWIEHLQGSNESALNHLRRAVVGLPRLPEVHYHLGRVYKDLGNTTWARYHLREASSSTEPGPGVEEATKLLESLAL